MNGVCYQTRVYVAQMRRSYYLLCDQCWECPLVKVWSLGLVSKYCNNCLFTVLLHLYFLQYYYHQLHASKLFSGAVLLLIFIHTTCISLSLRRTSAPIHLTSVLGVLGTQETSCIVIAGLLERDIFDLFLPEFDKPWVIHLRENLLLFYKPLLLEAQHCLQE